MKKAQSGTKVSKSTVKKNIKDATEMKNMRPVFNGPNSGPTVKPKVKAKCGAKMKKK